MRAFYSALFNLLIPFILLRLLWRSFKAPQYRKRWRERFAYYDKAVIPQVIWFHAVSVGEAEAVFPLIKRIRVNIPNSRILVTTTTPTGSARVQTVLGEAVQHVYLPYDTPAIVERFMLAFRPMLAVIMETELWPNLFTYCGQNSIPLFVINARLSKKSAKGYRKLPSLIRPLLANIKQVAAQTQEDAERFVAIGAKTEQVTVLGNIKFDLETPEQIIAEGKQLKSRIFKGRFVWIVASTHKGEDQIFLDIYKKLKPNIPELLLVLVPRHPERFGEVGELIRQNDLLEVSRTTNKPCAMGTDIYLANTMGELKMLYAAADIAFVGGSMLPVGGHNILEALAMGVPVLFGPYMANFKEIADKVLMYKAAIQCQGSEAIISAVQRLYVDIDYRNALVAKGEEFILQNRGVIDKLYKLLVNVLK